ncbi:hypothetical protein EJ03DRAFT_270778 [Teratosphaeria nubilosa]|uniref:N-acetylgalactosaminide beta-1,3-galactosyltransferase n=1 Tax=Teratosphaeria nubilosa TaxID=161662 RepID=A0A6G1LBR1_9PEZI|nr:hypothetical protein EJ03DRAFT_270778 [Teratosphaeria nubilosa]
MWSTDRRRLRYVATACAVLLLLSIFSFKNLDPNIVQTTLSGIRSRFNGRPSLYDETESEFYKWDTRSQFRPVKQPVDGKSVQDLCNAFPTHLLRDIQPVLKTGHAVLEARLRPHLETVSACLGDSLLISSDLDERINGHQVSDVLSDLRTDFINANEVLRGYRIQKALAGNDTLSFESLAQADVQGWRSDKFKFLPQISRTWRMRPEKRWYVFFEDDTYIVWDNLFRLLSNLAPNHAWYLGSPAPGARDTWMAYGGAGYILSREAMRRLVQHDFNAQGVFLGSKLSERWEGQMESDSCGDSVLGLALHEDARTSLSGLWPMIQPHPVHGIPFGDDYWCQPVITMHKNSLVDMAGLRRWEESRRDTTRPLLYADFVDYLNLTELTAREDWVNSDWRGYQASARSAHASFNACGRACAADPNCFQWTYHLRSCQLSPAFRLGQAKSPGIEMWRSDEEKASPWTSDELRYFAGWNRDRIRRWVNAKGRDCKQVQWVKPSLTRIF